MGLGRRRDQVADLPAVEPVEEGPAEQADNIHHRLLRPPFPEGQGQAEQAVRQGQFAKEEQGQGHGGAQKAEALAVGEEQQRMIPAQSSVSTKTLPWKQGNIGPTRSSVNGKASR